MTEILCQFWHWWCLLPIWFSALGFMAGFKMDFCGGLDLVYSLGAWVVKTNDCFYEGKMVRYWGGFGCWHERYLWYGNPLSDWFWGQSDTVFTANKMVVFVFCICKIGNKTRKLQVLSMSVYLYFIHYLLHNPNLILHHFELNLLLMICEPKLSELKKWGYYTTIAREYRCSRWKHSNTLHLLFYK